MLTARLVVRRYVSRTTFEGHQLLLREWRLWGVRVWSRELDREDVPVWASIQLACLGSSDWRSKFNDVPGIEWSR